MRQLSEAHIFPSRSFKDRTITALCTHLSDQCDLLPVAFPPEICYVFVITVFVLSVLLIQSP